VKSNFEIFGSGFEHPARTITRKINREKIVLFMVKVLVGYDLQDNKKQVHNNIGFGEMSICEICRQQFPADRADKLGISKNMRIISYW
jgi:hypothetical protein